MSTAPRPEFWRLLDETRPSGDDPRAHADAITERLTSHGVEAVVAFAQDMDAAMSTLYTWDLWGAAYLALDGCSDDAFQYLRACFVGAGEVAWALAAHEPEALFLNLLQTGDPASLDQGEHLLYAAGRAHEALTGSWLGGSTSEAEEPQGEPWEESDLPHTFPDLYRAVQSTSASGYSTIAQEIAIGQSVVDGLDAAATGNHSRAEDILRPIFDDPNAWSVVSRNSGSRTGVAYVLGIGDLLAGRVDRAAETFRRVADDIPHADELRRGLAQVELARGELDAAAELLDPAPSATRFDRILTAKLLWRRGETELAVDRAMSELRRPASRDDHPWDVAGTLLQAAQILVDAGLAEPARKAAKMMKPLLRRAEPDFQLVVEWRLLEASVDRLLGRPDRALSRIDAVSVADGYSKATWHRERARALRALGRESEAQGDFAAAVENLENAGERWEAAALKVEQAG